MLDVVGIDRLTSKASQGIGGFVELTTFDEITRGVGQKSDTEAEQRLVGYYMTKYAGIEGNSHCPGAEGAAVRV